MVPCFFFFFFFFIMYIARLDSPRTKKGTYYKKMDLLSHQNSVTRALPNHFFLNLHHYSAHSLKGEGVRGNDCN